MSLDKNSINLKVNSITDPLPSKNQFQNLDIFLEEVYVVITTQAKHSVPKLLVSADPGICGCSNSSMITKMSDSNTLLNCRKNSFLAKCL